MEKAATASPGSDGKLKDAKSKKTIGERLWGSAIGLGREPRIALLIFAVVSIVSMSFTQLGFWSIGSIDEKAVYIILLLGPLLMGSMLFGGLTGALLGFFAGFVLFVHAATIPLDYYEVYFMSPLNTFGLFTLIGAVSGTLFSKALKLSQNAVRRMLGIVAVCFVVSFATSVVEQINNYITYVNDDSFDFVSKHLFMTPAGVLVQALLDAVFVSVLCCLADRIVGSIANRDEGLRLKSIFGNWMLLVSFMVFMLASAIVFTIATMQSENSAEVNMESEVEYLQKQLAVKGDENLSSLIDGYTVELDGTVVITDESGNIQASNNDRYPKGGQLLKRLGVNGSEHPSKEETLSFFEDVFATDEGADSGVAAIQATDLDGSYTMDSFYIAAGRYAGGYIVFIRDSASVFTTRFFIMLFVSILAVVLILSVALLASFLLGKVVVSRIDETNASLGKITNGNLNERVQVKDSREFASLSSGINTTVSALKDTINEVEQRNAQELATAKAIQESVLPREFPPFPDIDKFDIYASMKTAKEVGGDFYDFFLIGDHKLGFVMADVSGKGIPAALFMMTAKTQVQNYMEAGLQVGKAIDAANHQLCIGNDAGMFVTMFACVLDYETGDLSYVNAGHNPPLILRDGVWEWMRGVSGMPLGLFDGIPYDAFSRKLAVNDMLFLYTDGVTEAMDAQGRLFGDDRLEETLYSYSDMNPRSVGVGVRRAITEFTLDAEQSDDITMLILKYGVPPEKRAVMVLPALDTQLVHVCNFIHEELHRRNAPKSVRNSLDIAAEELFVNVCHYAYPEATPENPGEVRIGFEYEANPPSLTVFIADDGIPYNPLEKPDAVTPDNIKDVPIGGLGILMAKQSVDEMRYERNDGSNVVTIVKKW